MPQVSLFFKLYVANLQRGKTSVEVDEKTEALEAFYMCRVSPGRNVVLNVEDSGVCITVQMA